MRNLGRRLQDLEDRLRADAAEDADGRAARLRVQLYTKTFCNTQRQQEGLEPIPLTPEEAEEDRRGDEELLRTHIPRLRTSPGWQSEEGQAMLSRWEADIRERQRSYREEKNNGVQ